MVALAPQAMGATVSTQESSVTVMHQPFASLEGSTGPIAWTETAATRAREAAANFILMCWCVCVGEVGVVWVSE